VEPWANREFHHGLLAAICFSLLFASVAAAQEPPELRLPSEEERADLFSFESAYFRQDDEGGNPFVNEDASIFEAIILIDKQVSELDRGHLRLIGDVISAASYDRIQQAATLTGATGVNPGSLGIGAGWDRTLGDWAFGVDADYENEYAYRSYNMGATLSRSLFERNTTLSLRVRGFRDIVRMIRFNGVEEDKEYRTTLRGEFGVTQVLSPESVMNVTLSHVDQEGFLATSFNSVFIDTGAPQLVEDFEKVPGRRKRSALTARYKRGIWDEDALEVGYRYYDDDWGIDSHTAELRLFKYLGAKSVLVEPNYRYYDQNGADFFAQSFDQAGLALQTSDSDLGTFTGNALGVDLRFLQVETLGVPTDYHLGVTFYERSDGLDFYWVSFGFDVPF